MKKINRPLLEEYLPVKFFLDDLYSIESLLTFEKSKYKIESENFEFSNVDELQKKYGNELITHLKISSNNPWINIELDNFRTRLYVDSNSNSEVGLFYKLNKIILASTRKPSFLYSYFNLSLAYISFTILNFLSHGFTNQIVSYLNYLLIAWAIWVFYINTYKHSEIILSKRHDMQSFLMRNKDALIVNLITGLIGAVFGVAGTVIAYKIGLLK